MASPLPKSPATRQRRNRYSSAATLVSKPPAERALPENRTWHEYTLAWWTTIWASPMAAEWVDADVPMLVRIARLDTEFWQTEDADLANKIAGSIDRLGRQFGLDPMARRSLQWTVKPPEVTAAPAAPTKVRDPRLRSVS